MQPLPSEGNTRHVWEPHAPREARQCRGLIWEAAGIAADVLPCRGAPVCRVCWLVFDTRPATMGLGLAPSEHGRGLLQAEVKHPSFDFRSDA